MVSEQITRAAERNTIRVKEFAELRLLFGLQGNERAFLDVY